MVMRTKSPRRASTAIRRWSTCSQVSPSVRPGIRTMPCHFADLFIASATRKLCSRSGVSIRPSSTSSNGRGGLSRCLVLGWGASSSETASSGGGSTGLGRVEKEGWKTRSSIVGASAAPRRLENARQGLVRVGVGQGVLVANQMNLELWIDMCSHECLVEDNVSSGCVRNLVTTHSSCLCLLTSDTVAHHDVEAHICPS